MAFYELNSEIKIGIFKPFKGVHEVRIKKSILNYMDTAIIKLPATVRLKQSGIAQTVSLETAKQFKRGDKVVVKLGYNGYLREEFRGFVSRVNKTSPCEIECEGYSFQLREKVLNKSWKNVKLLTVLQEIVEGTEIKLDSDIPDVHLAKLNLAVISGRSTPGVPVLDELKKALGGALFMWFDNDVLYVGLGYTKLLDKLNPVKYEAHYKIGWNTVSADDMKERIKGDVKIQVIASHRKKDGKYMEAKAGKSGGGVIRKRLQHVEDSSSQKDVAEALESLKNYSGFEGKITAFLIPFCKPGMKVKITNPRYPEMDSEMITDSTELTYSQSGARRAPSFTHSL